MVDAHVDCYIERSFSSTEAGMDRTRYLELVRGEARGPLASLARIGLRGAAAAYRGGVAARGFAFDRGLRRIESAPLPVVSVGNLTLGGTGKTPAVEWIARWYRRRGVRVAIVSRGYGATEGLNDEGLVLDANLPDVPHLQGADRAWLARVAAEELEAQLVVLDDGFQHRRLRRDLDVVLLDALEPFGLGRLFPSGLLREPVGALRRAGLVMLSRAGLVEPARRVEIRAEAERAAGPLAWCESDQVPLELLVEDQPPEPVGRLEGASVAAFCGIGNPDGFRRTLERLGCRIVAFRAFPDHHAYTRADLLDLTDWAGGSGAALALTTQKDSVKLRLDRLGALSLYALRIGLEFRSGLSVLEERLEGVRARIAA